MWCNKHVHVLVRIRDTIVHTSFRRTQTDSIPSKPPALLYYPSCSYARSIAPCAVVVFGLVTLLYVGLYTLHSACVSELCITIIPPQSLFTYTI